MDLNSYRHPRGRFAFHTTARENVASIRKDGLRKSAACGPDTQTATGALRSRGYDDPFPFDRSAVVYCYFDANDAVHSHEFANRFANDDVVVIVDLKRIPAPLYLADMSAASDFIEYRVAPDWVPETDTFEEAVQQYRESILRIGGLEEVPDQWRTRYGHPELVVNGDVPTEAIVDIQS